MDEHQVYWDSAEYQGEPNPNHLRLLEDWHEDEEAADDEEDDGEDDVHLDRPLKVRLFPPEVEKTTDGECDEERFHEGGEVDENVDI